MARLNSRSIAPEMAEANTEHTRKAQWTQGVTQGGYFETECAGSENVMGYNIKSTRAEGSQPELP
jgi:hypothetical protein